LSKRALTHLFVSSDQEKTLDPLVQLIPNLPPPFAGHAESLRHNLLAVYSTLGMPYLTSFAHVINARFQQILTAERIHALKIVPENEIPKDQKDKRSLQRADKKLDEELGDKKSILRFEEQTLESLDTLLEHKDFSTAAKEILRQGVVLVWGSLEVLSEDLFVTLLNVNPKLATQLLKEERTKRLFDLKRLDFELLEKFEFDISRKLGNIFLSRQRIDTIPKIKTVFGALFPENTSLRNALREKQLFMLNQRRHLIVHRRGIVDEQYLMNTKDDLALESELIITPFDLELYLPSVCHVGVEMLKAASSI